MNIVIPYKTLALLGGVILLIIVGIFTFRSSPQSPLPQPAIPQSSLPAQPVENVEIDVAHDPTSSPSLHRFTVTINTHSGDLSTFDAATNIVYRPTQGLEMLPTTVGGDQETHHRTIIVTYTNTSFPGTIVIKNLRGVPEQLFPFTNE